MHNKLAALINLTKHTPEKCLDQSVEALEKMKGEAEKEEEDLVIPDYCNRSRPYCTKSGSPG
jgi:hypothetical protein